MKSTRQDIIASNTTSTISRINPKAQPRDDAGNEALGCAVFDT
jgi:hypothetical protein